LLVFTTLGIPNIVKSSQVNFICIALNPNTVSKGFTGQIIMGQGIYDTPLALAPLRARNDSLI